MKKPLQQIFDNISELEPPKQLKMAVFARISMERKKVAIRRKIALMSGIFVSVAGLFAAGAFFAKDIVTSDFWSIFSLSFSDLGTLLPHWQEFSLSLLETFPVESFAYVLAPVFILLVLAQSWSMEHKTWNTKMHGA